MGDLIFIINYFKTIKHTQPVGVIWSKWVVLVCSELQERVRATQEELKDRCVEVEALKAQLAQLQQDAQEHVLVEVQAPPQSSAPQVFIFPYNDHQKFM